jgi:hypothetical protein
MSSDAVLIELDQRRRASLGKIGHEGHRRYLASVAPDGTITLRPAVVMTELEASFLSNPELVESIRRQRKDPSGYVKRPR